MSRAMEPVGGGRLWLSRAGTVALVVLAAQALWRGVLLGKGYFSQDDFLVMTAVQDASPGDVLGVDYAGGFSPVGALLVRLSTTLSPLGWPLAAGTVLLLQTAATAMLWPVLTRILGDRWLRLPLFVLFAFSSLTLWNTQWWVLGLEFWSSTLLLLVGVWAVLVAVQDDRPRFGLLAVATVAVAVLADDRAVLHPLVLFGIAVAVHGAATLPARARSVLAVLGPAWAGILVVLAAYVLLRWQVDPVDPIVGSELGDVVTNFLRHSVAEVFAGPWFGSLPAHAYLVPKSWVVAANGALLLALAGATLQRGGPSARAGWALLVVFAAATTGILTLAGRGELIGSLGLVHRYAAELAVVVVLCLAAAFRDLVFEPQTVLGRAVPSARVESGISGAATVLVLVSAVISTAFLAPNLYHRDDRRYVENLRAAVRADPQVVLLDSGVPNGVISAWYGDRAVVSSVIGLAPENPVFDLPSLKLRFVRPDGTLAPVALQGAVEAGPGESEECPFPVRDDGIEVPLQGTVPDGRWVLRIGYYTGTEGFVTAEVAGTTERFAVRSGLHAQQLVVEGSFDRVTLTFEQAGATVCVTDLSAGVPVAGVS